MTTLDIRRRLLLNSIKPLYIFEKGDNELANGAFSQNVWNGKPKFLNGCIVVSSQDAGEGAYYRGGGTIYGIDFTNYKKLHIKVNVPNYAKYIGGGGFTIGVGYGSVKEQYAYDSYFEPEEWANGEFYTDEGDYETEFDVSLIKGECPITLFAAGLTAEGLKAILYIYDIWLE